MPSPSPGLRTLLRIVVLLLPLLPLTACTRLVASPSPPDVDTIAVFPVDNRTGRDLFADAPPIAGFFGYPTRPRVTAADILTDEFARGLAARGFRVIAPPPSPGGEPAARPSTARTRPSRPASRRA